eukprot:4027091-Pleurochrysis_carterae.AAC.2
MFLEAYRAHDSQTLASHASLTQNAASAGICKCPRERMASNTTNVRNWNAFRDDLSDRKGMPARHCSAGDTEQHEGKMMSHTYTARRGRRVLCHLSRHLCAISNLRDADARALFLVDNIRRLCRDSTIDVKDSKNTAPVEADAEGVLQQPAVERLEVLRVRRLRTAGARLCTAGRRSEHGERDSDRQERRQVGSEGSQREHEVECQHSTPHAGGTQAREKGVGSRRRHGSSCVSMRVGRGFQREKERQHMLGCKRSSDCRERHEKGGWRNEERDVPHLERGAVGSGKGIGGRHKLLEWERR